jgi:hypothetical protein
MTKFLIVPEDAEVEDIVLVEAQDAEEATLLYLQHEAILDAGDLEGFLYEAECLADYEHEFYDPCPRAESPGSWELKAPEHCLTCLECLVGFSRYVRDGEGRVDPYEVFTSLAYGHLYPGDEVYAQRVREFYGERTDFAESHLRYHRQYRRFLETGDDAEFPKKGPCPGAVALFAVRHWEDWFGALVVAIDDLPLLEVPEDDQEA